MKNRLFVLDRGDASGGETRTITNSVDLIDDCRFLVAGPQEVSVQGMHGMGWHGARCSHQRLAQHLATKDGGAADIVAAAAKQVDFELLELQVSHELVQQHLPVA